MKKLLGLTAFIGLVFICPSLLMAQSVRELSGRPAAEQSAEELYGARPPHQHGPIATISLGVGVAVAPEFEGSDKYKVAPLPIVEVAFMNAFLSTSRGLGVNLLDSGEWTLAPTLRYRFGRDQDDSDLLRGLGDVDGGAEIGLLAAWKPNDFSVSLKGYQGLGQAHGFTLAAELDYSRELIGDLRGTVGLSAMFANHEYNQDFFGVTEWQSAASGYREYRAGSGVKHAAVNAGLTYAISDSVMLNLFGEYRRLTGPAADSPLVERGSANQFMSGLALIYRFGQ